MSTGRLKAGLAEMDITPEVGVTLARELRCTPSTAVRGPLTAKSLALTDGRETLVIVTLDLFGLTHEHAARATQTIADRAAVRPEGVMVVSSHTRGAPPTAPVVGHPDVDLDYADGVVAALGDLVADAAGNLQDASLGVGRAKLPHLIYNHRLVTRNMKTITAWLGVPPDEVLQPEGPVDPDFTVMTLRDTRGDLLCLLWNFAADNRFCEDDKISPGLPGLVQQAMDARTGRHVPCLYLPGCGGNVSFIHDLERTADAVASAVMAVQLETSCDPLVRLGCAAERIVLPIRDASEFWHRPDIELKCPEALDAFAREVELLRAGGAHAVPAAVQAFRLGRFALVALPGVPFVEFALAIKSASPFSDTLVVGNAGENAGWVITRTAFEHGGFEAWTARSARIGPGGGEFMAEESVRLLRGLRGLAAPAVGAGGHRP